jgi:hypothetical protein
MKTVAIAAGSRIRVSSEDGFTMDALRVTIVRMAGRTFLDDPDLIPFPWNHLVDVFMAVFTLNIIDKVGTRIMFCPFLFMAPMAGDRFRMNPCPLCLSVGLDISNVQVATVAGIGSMNGLCKFPLPDLLVATQTFRVVDTL